MSDPEVISDQRRYAEVGRAYRALEPAHQLAQEWRRATTMPRARASCSPRTATTRRRGSSCATSEERLGELEEEIRLAMVEPRPERRQGRDRRDPARRGRRRGRHCSPATSTACSTATPSGAASRPSRSRVGDGDFTFAVKRRRRLQRLQVRGRHPPRAARAGDRVAGPHPHLDRDGGGAARGRGRRRADRPERPPDRRLPLVRARRAVREHDRLGGAHHAQADRARRVDAGREVAAPEPRQGDARAARAPATSASWPRSRPSWRPSGSPRWAPASAPRRSAPTTSRRTASPTTASNLTKGNLPGVLQRRARRLHRRARGRREAPQARGRASRVSGVDGCPRGASTAATAALDGGRLRRRRGSTPSS